MSFHRFRTNHSSYDRQDMPRENTSRALYRPRFSRASSSHSTSTSSSSATSTRTRTPSLEEDIIPLTSSLSLSSNNSFTMKTLNPRRLSMRLKGKSVYEERDDTAARSHHETSHPERERGVAGGRADFIYKPLQRTDYTAVISSASMGHTQRSPTAPTCLYSGNHIPSQRGRRAGLDEKVPVRARAVAPQAQTQSRSRSRARAQAYYTRNGEDDIDTRSDLYNDMDEQYITSSPRPREANVYTSAAEKRRKRAAKRLTTVMVPDAEDIYG
ncbi:hypothetical protein BDV18DRAFT_142907 [Aspergillus unguis]